LTEFKDSLGWSEEIPDVAELEPPAGQRFFKRFVFDFPTM
jgi:hypothetical protein